MTDINKNLASIGLAILFSLGAMGQSFAQDKITEFQLDNGLQVVLRPIEGSKKTCLFTVFRFGNLHDLDKQNGVAHFAEHLYITAATKGVESRTAEAFMTKYANAWNAQTGDDYTLFSTVFASEKLPTELAEAANRMTRVTVSEKDREREVPRIATELNNMFLAVPSLAVQNAARQAISPMENGTRRCGTLETVKKLSVKHLQQFLDDHYKPNNAILVVTGGFDAKTTEQLIREGFGGIPQGKPPARSTVGKPNTEATIRLVGPKQNRAQPYVAVSIANPLPGDPLYPAFLVVIGRLQQESRKLTSQRGAFPIRFTPLDLPYFSNIVLQVENKQDPNKSLAKIDEWMNEILQKKLGPREAAAAQRRFGYILGLGKLSDRVLSRQPYLLALQLARQKQLNYDPQKLAVSFDQVDQEQVDRVIEKYFGRKRRVRVVWQRAGESK